VSIILFSGIEGMIMYCEVYRAGNFLRRPNEMTEEMNIGIRKRNK
jgi:hypothetical protein